MVTTNLASGSSTINPVGHKYSRDEILTAAVTSVLTDGLHRLTYGRVAREIGTSDRVVAYYFPTTGRMHAIEVTKGPAAVRYGPRTTGGAINLFSTPVPEEFSGFAQAFFGSEDRQRAHAWLGGRGDVAGSLEAGGLIELNWRFQWLALAGVGAVLAVLAMVAGGLWASRKVISALAYRVTALDRDTGLAANAANTGLVGAASLFGLPLSTTHVSGAALVGSARSTACTRGWPA